MITLAIDAMGGDRGLAATLPAARMVVERHPEVRLLLVGDARAIEAGLAGTAAALRERLEVVAASEQVGMDEAPTAALRKKDSSMRVAINLVGEGRAGGCVSAGNTGALMATAYIVLKTLPGIDRPAICSGLPRLRGKSYVLDLGANVDSPPSILMQFGIMGAVLVRCLEGKSHPSVGLLNIGEEEVKGNDTVKAAAELFKASALNYVGYVEADAIYVGDTDVIVSDGVSGNVALKASEGAARMIMAALGEEFRRTPVARARAWLAAPVLRILQRRLDPRRYNGASMLGLNGTVVKSHGGTDALGFRHAVEVGMEEVGKGMVKQLRHAMTAATEPLAPQP